MDQELTRWLGRSREFIEESKRRPLRLADAAQSACLSPFYYHRLFTQAFGQTPHEFHTELRLQEAKLLLAKEDLPVGDVCLKLGYASPASFSTMFLDRFGVRPSEYRRSAKSYFIITGYRGLRYIPHCFIAPNQFRKIR